VVPGPTAAIVLNYQTPAATIRAVESLRATRPSLARVLIVDNGSRDDSLETIRAALPDVDLIAVDRNEGFSAGCNAGIRDALAQGADRVFLLNSDAAVLPETLSALERALAADPQIGIAGPMVVETSRPDVVQSLGIRYHRATGRMRHYGYASGRPTDASRPRIVDGVSGCAMLIRREVFAAIGHFAEEYFFGFEDLDFCLRARGAGFLSTCVTAAEVRHEGSLSIGRASALRTYFATRNHLLLASRVSPHRSGLSRLAQTGAIGALNLAHVLVSGEVPRREGLRGFAAGLRDHLAGRYGPPPPAMAGTARTEGSRV
jgi:GT2 family glycosyltransferase